MTPRSRSFRYTHDPVGRVLSEHQDGAELLHSYSERGMRLTSVLPDGRFIRYGHDRNNALDAIHYGDRQILDIRRDRLGRELHRQAGTLARQTDYDPQGRIRRQAAYRTTTREQVFARGYNYDSVSNITSIEDATRGEFAFRYDERDRLRSAASADHEERFAFDPASTVLVGVDNPRDASVEHGLLRMRGDCHYDYDDAGNRIAMRRGQGGAHQFRYVYNDDNRLIEVHETRGRTRRLTRFAYDALGRRVSKAHRETIEAANTPTAPGIDSSAELVRDDTIWFLWDGPVLLAEGRGNHDGAIDPLAIVYVHEPGSFRPAAQIRRHSAEEEARVLIYWLDHLGTPQELSNDNGELVWQVALKAWGRVDRMLIGRVEQNLRFQGQYHDAETGLHYNRFRHYDPAAGIYLNQDPLGLLGGTNIYAYPTDPLSGIDPFGLVELDYKGAGGNGYTVYGLGEFDKSGNLIRTVYVGQTETDRYHTRMQEHKDSGRYYRGLRHYEITRVDTYAEARGAEQYHIENVNDGKGSLDTSQRGGWYDEANGKRYGPGLEANRVNSYNQDRVLSGDDKRAKAFNKAYIQERDRMATTTSTCK
ncbi:RHS repeat-associated core domain-containing protein [Tessaracoccus flavescens]|uniref:RHS repeat-associated core domain-containing protein n=1 Tax=Tessaracoccus flavescens TaxID=399497 RepID=UPI00137477C8|nr:RHS repeat-associated core domain-containing protein [Tessaracoccus flavescens]